MRLLEEPSEPVGIRWWTKPVITELPISPNLYIVVFTDGLLHAGRRSGGSSDVGALVQELASEGEAHASERLPAEWFADALLSWAMEAEQGRPRDDISVLVVAILPAAPHAGEVRRMSVRYPIRIDGTGI
jgi:hypothetical protein